MKTTSLVKGVAEDKVSSKTIDENKGVVLGARRQLQALQQAAGDKENLVGGGRLCQESMPPSKEKYPSSSKNREGTPSKKSKPAKSYEKKTITAEDLTTEESPGVAYWEELCEKQRAALEEALKENEMLHKRVAALERENHQCKILLEETKALVDTLTEIIDEKDEGEE